MRMTQKTLNDKITYASEMLGVNITNSNYNGFNHLRINGENLFTGTIRECCEFLNGLVQFKLLTA